MSGRHARPADDSESEATLRDVVVGLAALGAIGLVIYLAVAGYDLAFWCLLWLVWAALIVQCLVRRKRRDWFWPWAAAGQLFLATDNLASSLGARHMWLAQDKHVLMLISDSARWTAYACTGIAIILGIKSGELLWSRRKSRPATDEPD